MFSYLFTFNFDIVNKSNISNTVLLKSPCIVMGPLDAHVSSYRVWNEKKEQSNILICQLISPFIVFFVRISYSYHKGNKKPGHDAVCIIITHNVTLNVSQQRPVQEYVYDYFSCQILRPSYSYMNGAQQPNADTGFHADSNDGRTYSVASKTS